MQLIQNRFLSLLAKRLQSLLSLLVQAIHLMDGIPKMHLKKEMARLLGLYTTSMRN